MVAYEEQKTKNMTNFWFKSLRSAWSLMREFLKQYLTEKQNGLFSKWLPMGPGCLRKVVAMRVDCNIKLSTCSD